MKGEVRIHMRQLRSSLSDERRLHAKTQLEQTLIELLRPYNTILSFSPFGTEIDLSGLNDHLSSRNALHLPPPQPHHLAITPDIILVPALAFDQHKHRIGYGRGYYDQLITKFPSIPSWGIGFREQLVDTLPRDPWDQPLTALHLF
jgi:5-formyltetrahydrofolate cyclo-ligase